MIRTLLKVGFYIIRLLVLFILGAVILFTLPYFLTEFYKFSEPRSFEGNIWYNPYHGMDSSAWHKGNFQVQSKAWSGITDGRINSNEAIDSIYSYYGYDIIATSDYMKINEWGKEKPYYLKVYEHGYSIFKRHQIIIGAERVNWMDFPFFQNIHHKQKIINTLRPDSKLIYLAHPDLSGSYDLEDFSRLTGYDGIEAHSIFGDAIDCWDMALSSGHYVTIQSNDDSHNVFSPNLTGNYCTFINTTDFDTQGILNAMKQGNAYAVRLFRERNEPFEVKRKRHDQLARLKRFEVVNDSLFIELDKASKEIRFVGQNGEVKKELFNQSSAFYHLKNDDTYIRTEFEFPDSTLFFLNPVARTDAGKPISVEIKGINWVLTWLYRLFILVLEGIFILLFWYIFKNFRLKKT